MTWCRNRWPSSSNRSKTIAPSEGWRSVFPPYQSLNNTIDIFILMSKFMKIVNKVSVFLVGRHWSGCRHTWKHWFCCWSWTFHCANRRIQFNVRTSNRLSSFPKILLIILLLLLLFSAYVVLQEIIQHLLPVRHFIVHIIHWLEHSPLNQWGWFGKSVDEYKFIVVISVFVEDILAEFDVVFSIWLLGGEVSFGVEGSWLCILGVARFYLRRVYCAFFSRVLLEHQV